MRDPQILVLASGNPFDLIALQDIYRFGVPGLAIARRAHTLNLRPLSVYTQFDGATAGVVDYLIEYSRSEFFPIVEEVVELPGGKRHGHCKETDYRQYIKDDSQDQSPLSRVSGWGNFNFYYPIFN